MATYTKPQQLKKEESDRLKFESDQINFIDLKRKSAARCSLEPPLSFKFSFTHVSIYGKACIYRYQDGSVVRFLPIDIMVSGSNPHSDKNPPPQ